MSRYIAAEVMEQRVREAMVNSPHMVPLIKFIRSIPTADVAEVLRCKDCKFYEVAEYDGGTKDVCRLLKRQMYEDDFCSYGEKSENRIA